MDEVALKRHPFRLCQCGVKGDGGHVPLVQGDHMSYFALRNHVHRYGTETGSQESVKGRRGAAPLEMSQDGDAHVGVTYPPQLGGHHFPDPSQPGHATKLAFGLVDGFTTMWHTALSHNYQAKLRSALVALLDLVSDDVQVIGHLGY